MKNFQKAVPVNPPQDQVNALLSLYHSRQMVMVEETCSRLLNTYPTSIIVFNILGTALQAQRKLPEAVESYEKAIQLKPDFALAYYNRGNALKGLGQLKEAVESYEKAIQIKPDYPQAYSNRGTALKELGQLKKAVKSYEKAIQIKPDYAQAYYNIGIAIEELGQLKEAVKSYEKAIQIKPDFAQAYYNRGNALNELGQLKEAVESYEKAIQIKPDYAQAYSNRGIALQDLGQLKEAVESYEKAIQIKPDYAQAYSNRGIALKELGQLKEAVESYEKAIQLKPDYAQAYSNRGIALKELGQLKEAVESYEKAIQLKPDYAQAYYNRGIALKELGRLKGAVESYEKAIQLKPDDALAYSNHGIALKELGQMKEAVKSYEKAIQLKPDDAQAYSNRGNALKELGQLKEAVKSYEKAIQIKPDFAQAYYNRGTALNELGQLKRAVKSYEKAIQIKPDYAQAYSNRGNALKDLGQLKEAVKSYEKAIELKPDYTKAYSNLLLALNYSVDDSRSDKTAAAIRFNRIFTQKVRSSFSGYRCLPNPEKLRVGFVSGDLRRHPVGYFLEGVLSCIDSSAMELIAYPSVPKSDDLTERIRSFFSAWKPIHTLNDEAAANLIYRDEVHVLFDLSGHTAHNRLPMFCWKPAPVQVSWLGYCATTGLSQMDYIMGDANSIPKVLDSQFTEKVWRLPELYICLTPPDIKNEVAALPALKNGTITFGSFNNLTKMNDEVVAVWAKILEAVPNSKLLLKTKQLDDMSVREDVLKRFALANINQEQIILKGRVNRAEHFKAYNEVDIAFDPFPYQGVTTSFESLWMGVPVLTLAGDSFVSRQGIGIMKNAGLPDWVADDKEEYVAKAIDFASDIGGLAEIRAGLRAQVLVSPLFDAQRFAKNFEDAVWQMWRHCNDLHPHGSKKPDGDQESTRQALHQLPYKKESVP